MADLETPYGKPTRTYNWPVLGPLLAHFFPARFSGMHQLLQRQQSMELRLAHMEKLLGEIAFHLKSIAEGQHELFRKGKELSKAKRSYTHKLEKHRLSFVVNDVLPVDCIEADIFSLTPSQLQCYLDGIGEVLKFGAFVDPKKTPAPKLIITVWEQDWKSMLLEAKAHGLEVPNWKGKGK